MKRISFPYQQNDFECPPISYMNEYAKVVYVLATRIDDCRPTDVVSVLKDVRNFETYSKEHTPTKHTALNHVPMFSVAELAMLFLLLELDDFPQMDQEEETNQTIGNLDTSTTTQIKDSSAENILMSIKNVDNSASEEYLDIATMTAQASSKNTRENTFVTYMSNALIGTEEYEIFQTVNSNDFLYALSELAAPSVKIPLIPLLQQALLASAYGKYNDGTEQDGTISDTAITAVLCAYYCSIDPRFEAIFFPQRLDETINLQIATDMSLASFLQYWFSMVFRGETNVHGVTLTSLWSLMALRTPRTLTGRFLNSVSDYSNFVSQSPYAMPDISLEWMYITQKDPQLETDIYKDPGISGITSLPYPAGIINDMEIAPDVAVCILEAIDPQHIASASVASIFRLLTYYIIKQETQEAMALSDEQRHLYEYENIDTWGDLQYDFLHYYADILETYHKEPTLMRDCPILLKTNKLQKALLDLMNDNYRHCPTNRMLLVLAGNDINMTNVLFTQPEPLIAPSVMAENYINADEEKTLDIPLFGNMNLDIIRLSIACAAMVDNVDDNNKMSSEEEMDLKVLDVGNLGTFVISNQCGGNETLKHACKDYDKVLEYPTVVKKRINASALSPTFVSYELDESIHGVRNEKNTNNIENIALIYGDLITSYEDLKNKKISFESPLPFMNNWFVNAINSELLSDFPGRVDISVLLDFEKKYLPNSLFSKDGKFLKRSKTLKEKLNVNIERIADTMKSVLIASGEYENAMHAIQNIQDEEGILGTNDQKRLLDELLVSLAYTIVNRIEEELSVDNLDILWGKIGSSCYFSCNWLLSAKGTISTETVQRQSFRKLEQMTAEANSNKALVAKTDTSHTKVNPIYNLMVLNDEIKRFPVEGNINIGYRHNDVWEPVLYSDINSNLIDFCIDITEQAFSDKFVPDYSGREDVLHNMQLVLTRKEKTSPALVGESGVGKTSIVYKLANKIVKGDVLDGIKNMRIFMLDKNAIMNNITTSAMLENRIIDIMKAASAANVIIFIDDIHTASENVLFSIARGISQYIPKTIVCTTNSGWTNKIKPEVSLYRQFTEIRVPEPNFSEIIEFVENRKQIYEAFYGMKYDADLSRVVALLASDYISSTHSPEREIDLLDLSATIAKSQKKEIVTEEDVYQAVRMKTGNDSIHSRKEILNLKGFSFITNGENKTTVKAALKKENTSDLSEEMPPSKENNCSSISSCDENKNIASAFDAVAGHAKTKQAIIERLVMSQLTLVGKDRPKNILIFAGPSGVGKTYLARQIPEFLGLEKEDFKLMSMANFNEAYNMSRLIGSAPGYIGYDKGGELTNFVMAHPSGVIILDEIEKASPEIVNAFLGVFDSGFIDDARGQHIDCRGITFICTTNAGFEKQEKSIGFGIIKEHNYDANIDDARNKLINSLGAPFVGRMDEIFYFGQLTHEDVKQACYINMCQMIKDYKSRLGLDLDNIITREELERIIDERSNDTEIAELGARGVWKTVENEIKQKILQAL